MKDFSEGLHRKPRKHSKKRVRVKKDQSQSNFEQRQRGIAINQEMNNYASPGLNAIDSVSGMDHYHLEDVRNKDLNKNVSKYLADHNKKPFILSKNDRLAYEVAQGVINGRVKLPSKMQSNLATSYVKGKKQCKSEKKKQKKEHLHKDVIDEKVQKMLDENEKEKQMLIKKKKEQKQIQNKVQKKAPDVYPGRPNLDFESSMFDSLYGGRM